MLPDRATALELASTCQERGVALPHTQQSMKRMLARHGFDVAPYARIRSSAGGRPALEYDWQNIPVLIDLKMKERSIALRKTDLAEKETGRAVAVQRQPVELSQLNARQRSVMDARAAILHAIDAYRLAEGLTQAQAIAAYIERIDTFTGAARDVAMASASKRGTMKISARTIERWFKMRRVDGVGGLAPARTKTISDIPTWFWDFVRWYAQPQKPCITEAIADYRKSGKAVSPFPSYDQIRRLIGKLGNVEKHRGREGSLTLKSRMAYVMRSTADLLPTCVFTADGKTFDAEVQNPFSGKAFKPEITSIVDVATRKCVGWSVGLAENQLGTTDALRYACEQHGIPAIFYVDNGSGFKNRLLEDDLTGLHGRLGITPHHSLPHSSQARGIIERFNGSVWNPLSEKFDSYMGAKMDRQAKMLNFKVTRKDLKEFGTSRKLPTWEEFIAACQDAVDDYNSTGHSSLPGRMSPNEFWAYHVEQGFEPVTITGDQGTDEFRPYFKRRVRRCLIELQTNKYFAIELTEFDGDDVLVGMDVHDASKVWVRKIDTTDEGEKRGRLICIATFGGNEARYIPLTMQKAALETRNRARVKRLEDKMDVVAAELRPAALLEQTGQRPMKVIGERDEFLVPANDRPAASTIEHNAVEDKRPVKRGFASDAELAQWAITNPEELSEGQRSVLQECLRSRTDRELLELEGVDLDQLKAVIRIVA